MAASCKSTSVCAAFESERKSGIKYTSTRSAQVMHDHTISVVGVANSAARMCMRRDNSDLSNAVGKVEIVASLSFFDEKVFRLEFQQLLLVSIAFLELSSVTVCFVIATGSACSVDLAGRFNL